MPFFMRCILLYFMVVIVGVRCFHNLSAKQSPYTARTQLSMGNNAQFGIFSPAVYAAKLVLGEGKLNKLRGKSISLHSQAITEWCMQYGAYNLRLKLIKKAKKNGDRLGFLV